MKKILIVILICLMLPTSVSAVTYGKTGESTNFNGDVGVPTGKGYYINGVQVTSAILSDVASIAMLDEAETVTANWTFSDWLDISRANDMASSGGGFNVYRERDGDPTSDVASGDMLGGQRFYGWHTGSWTEGAAVKTFVDGTPGDNDMPGRLEFLTTPDASDTPALRIAIDNAGNIKMGDGAWTNYVNVSAAGALTFVGTAGITLSDVTMSLGSDADGDIYYRASNKLVRLAKGAATNVLKMNAGATAPEWSAAGAGDVTKVGTPVNSQIGVWTGDGTIEGAASLTYDGANLQLTGDIGATGARITKGWFTNLETTGDLTVNGTALAAIYANLGANTDITSLVNAALTVGRDADNEIDFSTDNVIQFRTSAADCVSIGTAGEIDLQQFYILLDDALGTDHDYSGLVDSDTVGESVVFGDLLYFNWTDVEWKKAKADAIGTTPCQRIALETKANGEACLMLVQGWIRDDSAFDFGASRIFLNDDTAGTCDDTAPAESGDQIQVVGIGTSADTMFFNPSIDVGEI